MTTVNSTATDKPLERRFGLLPATALNMTNMIGVGPFITIPLLMTALGGPQAMLGWIVALVIVICDGMVWSELGAAMPGSGGSFHYLREAFGKNRFGRLMAFLFVWQFVLSGPLEIASGYIGFADYASYIWKGLTRPSVIALITAVGLINIALLYRRINSIVKITVSLWIGTLITVLAVIITGAMHFDSRVAFDFPPGAFNFSLGFFLGLGEALRDHGVRVLVVRPGFVMSKMTRGIDKAPLAVTPEQVAEAVVRAITEKRQLIWVPPPMRVVMAGLRHVPRPIFRRLPI